MYAVPRGQRAGVRRRLAQGVHLPHPDITQTSGRRVTVVAGKVAITLEVEGVPGPPATRITVEIVPEAFLIVV